VEEHEDGLTIHGTGGEPLRGTGNARVKSLLDHRIAMSMAVAGLVSEGGVEVDDISPINTSFPTFMGLLEKAGAA
jgi:3-phosphoshikimate 1-carboxyvinyltransferase